MRSGAAHDCDSEEDHALQEIFFGSLLVVNDGVMDFINHETSSRIVNSAESERGSGQL
jgi:hypothetical protein